MSPHAAAAGHRLSFFREDGHLTIEELYVRVHAEDPTVGQSTVYRTMKLLCESGLAREVSFGGGVVRYERARDWHHDHLICERCGRSLEVVDPDIEVLQESLVRKYGFIPTQHRLYLYGVCPECLSAERSASKEPVKKSRSVS